MNLQGLSAPYRYQDNINKWTHIAVRYDYSTQKSTVFINGNKVGEGTHSARYESNLNLLLGRFDTTTTLGKISQVRVGKKYQTDVNMTDSAVTSLYNTEKKYLFEIN